MSFISLNIIQRSEVYREKSFKKISSLINAISFLKDPLTIWFLIHSASLVLKHKGVTALTGYELHCTKSHDHSGSRRITLVFIDIGCIISRTSNKCRWGIFIIISSSIKYFLRYFQIFISY